MQGNTTPTRNVQHAGPGSVRGSRLYARNATAGLSLIEVIFAMAILAVGLVSVLGLLVQSHEANVLNRNRVTALDEAQAMLGAIRSAIARGVAVPKEIIEEFPEAEIPLESSRLPGAVLRLSYGKQDGNPLDVNIEVEWRDMRGRTSKVRLCSAIGKY